MYVFKSEAHKVCATVRFDKRKKTKGGYMELTWHWQVKLSVSWVIIQSSLVTVSHGTAEVEASLDLIANGKLSDSDTIGSLDSSLKSSRTCSHGEPYPISTIVSLYVTLIHNPTLAKALKLYKVYTKWSRMPTYPVPQPTQ